MRHKVPKVEPLLSKYQCRVQIGPIISTNQLTLLCTNSSPFLPHSSQREAGKRGRGKWLHLHFKLKALKKLKSFKIDPAKIQDHASGNVHPPIRYL